MMKAKVSSIKWDDTGREEAGGIILGDNKFQFQLETEQLWKQYRTETIVDSYSSSMVY